MQMMQELIFRCNAMHELLQVASALLDASGNKRVFTLTGRMGAGKTTLVKELCKVLGVNDVVASPTFTILNEYFSPTYGKIYHFDFYRIKDEAEAYDLGYEEYFYSGNYCFIEWPEKINSLIPAGHAGIIIKTIDEVREITLKYE